MQFRIGTLVRRENKGHQHVNGDSLAVRQEKTGTTLMIPMHPELAGAIVSVPRTNMTFLMTEKGLFHLSGVRKLVPGTLR